MSKEEVTVFLDSHDNVSKVSAILLLQKEFGFTEGTATSYYNHWKSEYMKEHNQGKKPVTKQEKPNVPAAKEAMPSTLKVNSMDIEGENGKYKIGRDGILLTNDGLVMKFETTEQLDLFFDEFKQVFKLKETIVQN